MRKRLMSGVGRSIGIAAVVASAWLGLAAESAAQCISATLMGQLGPKRGSAFDHFGYSVAVAGDTAVVGVPDGPPPGSSVDSGVAYVFVRSGGVWTPQAILTHPSPELSDNFGSSVAINGETIVVGAHTDNTPAGTGAGSASVFVRTGGAGGEWSLQQQLTAPGGAAGDLFGSSVAISGDTIVVGAWADDTVAGAEAGSAYVFVRTGTVWTAQALLNPLDAAAGDEFGEAVAIDGNTLVVGASDDDTPAGSAAGSAYVYVRSGTVWSQQQKLTASDGTAFDQLGIAVSVSGSTVVVGAWADDDMGSNSGSAYVYTRSGTVWTQQQKLTAFDGTAADRFGRSLSLSGETVVVGSDDGNIAPSPTAGAAYVFTRSAGVWSLQQKLTPSDGAPGDWFGSSVSISSETIITGARFHDGSDGTESGAAYVHVRSGSTWSQQQKLQTPDGVANDELGSGVAVSGTTALVGNPETLTANGRTGSVLVYERSGSTWFVQAELIAPDGATGDHFGFAVAIEGNTAVVGAYGDDVVGTNEGSVYVYVRSGSTWTLQQKLTATTSGLAVFFGGSVAISGETVVIGSSYELNGSFVQVGAAHVFTRSGTVWSPQQVLFASDGSSFDLFGDSVVVSGDTIAVGAPLNDTAQGTDAGNLYIFTRTAGVWTQQHSFASSETAGVSVFGSSLALEGDTLAVGSENHSALQPNWGAAYVFTRSGGLNGAWTQRAILRESDNTPGLFGASLSLSGDVLCVGSPLDNASGGETGSADIFKRTGGLTGSWTWRGNVMAPDRAAGDLFGAAVGLSGSTLIVGAYWNDTPVGTNAGMAYAFELSDPSACPIDFDCSGIVTVGDIFAFLNAWFSGNPLADFDGGGLAVSDVFAFLNAWFLGC